MIKAIELDFPFEKLDPIAQLESWRKEVNRPIYHIHKWWANRLGSVFRAILAGAFLDEDENIWDKFYSKDLLFDKIVLDPFMGSGTTLGEAAKLGIKPIGCDINPISTFIVKQSLTKVDIKELERTYEAIKKDVCPQIDQYYKTLDPINGTYCDVLYYFWVKELITDNGEKIPLFSNYVFSKDAYPNKKPISQILCPECGQINTDRYDTNKLTCKDCNYTFNPQVGTTDGQNVIDKFGHQYKIKDLIKSTKCPPHHRLYAIMALTNQGKTKVYLSPKQFDINLYNQASKTLSQENLPLPDMIIRSGHNTNQARNYNYLNWKQFFNDRQLLCLGILLKRILEIKDSDIREQFLCLFSGTLEFNNLFCSFKGEGTGAVRHMFSNHILKPERTPIENNVWGTPKSSGAFSTLFKSRLLRAKEYLDNPFEIQQSNNGRNSSVKVVCSPSIDIKVTEKFEKFIENSQTALILNGDSACLPIPNFSVDAVVTDPPYFDFVHYSELSDFFFAWLAPVLKNKHGYFQKDNSSDKGEVQDKCPQAFAHNLERVFKESYRVLKDEGLLIFSFHHSKTDAWLAIYQAITQAGFFIAAAHPIKAEMAGARPKNATKYPINLDSILVCKKRTVLKKDTINVMVEAQRGYSHYIKRYKKINRQLATGDKLVIMASQVLVYSSMAKLPSDLVEKFLDNLFNNKEKINSLDVNDK